MTEPLTVDELVAGILRPWRQETAADATSLSPFDAASLAVHATLTDCRNKTGTILITSAYSDDAKAVLNLLRAFYADSELSKLLVKTLPDGVELVGGTKIIVTSTTSRRPRDVLKRLKLARRGDAHAREWTRADLVKAIHEVLLGGPDDAARTIAADLGDWTWDDIVEMRNQHNAEIAARIAEREPIVAAPEASKPSVPIIPRQPDRVLQDGEDFFSETWEAANATRKMMAGWNKQHEPRVLRVRPREAIR